MHFLARELCKKDGRNGSTFYSSLAIPTVIKGNLLQRILLDGGQKIPPLKDLRLTYGNRIAMSRRYESDGVFDIICPEDFTSSADHLLALEKEFELLNDPAKSFKQRLDLWNHSQPGFIMALFGSDGMTSGIGCLANPVCTQSGTASGTFGAPVWTDIFSQQFCDGFVGVGTTASHCIVGSLCHETWSLLGSNRDAFIDGLLPVVMTSGSAIGCKPLNGDVFQLIFIPFQGEAPVGFFVDPQTTYDEYVSGFTSTIAYKNFIHLLKKFRPTFEPWFNKVNANPTAFAVPLQPAKELWDKFPTTADPDGNDLVDPLLLEPLLIQQNRFLRASLDDIILRAPCGAQVADETMVRCQYNCWSQRAADCYPTELGTQRPVARQAFLEQLLPPDGGWSPTYKSWFSVCDLDPVIPLPPSYAKYTPMKVPTTADVVDGWVAKRLDEPVPAVDPLAAFRKAARERKTPAQRPTSPALPTSTIGSTATPAPSLVQGASGQVITPGSGDTQGSSSVSVARLGSLMNGATPSPGDSRVRFATSNDGATTGSSAPPHMTHPSSVKRPLSYDPFGATGFNTASAIQLDGDATPPQNKRARHSSMVPPHNLFGIDGDTAISAPQMTHMRQSAVFSPEKMSRPTDPYNEMMMGHYQQPFIIQTNGTVTRPKYATMEASRIDTVAHRKKCNPVFLQLCLLLAFPCDKGDQIYFPESGYTAKSDDFLFAKPPSDQGACFLAGFDHANNGVDAANAMSAAIYYRWSADPELGMFGHPTHDWQSKLTPSFIQRGYTVASWSMRTDRLPPRANEEKHSLLSFLPLIDPSYSSDAIPTGGIPLRKMLQMTRFVYFFYSMPGCKRGNHGLAYDDSNFQRSVFGSVLRIMCRILLNHELVQPWEKDQEACTVAFITDLSELFELMADFVRHRVGADPVLCGIADGAFSQRQMQLIVAPATMTPHHITSLPSNIVQQLDEYRHRMERTWVRGRFMAHQGNQWSSSSSSLLLNRSVSPQAGSNNVDRDREKSQSRAKKTNGKTQTESGPLVSVPLFEYVGTKEFSSAKTLVPHLIKEVTKGDWPTLVIGEKRHTLCLHSSFKGFCTCDKHESCRTPRPFPGFAKTRLHVDLKDVKWSSTNFGEEKWEPVVTFLKSYHKLIKPTEALKKLTPSANWPA